MNGARMHGRWRESLALVVVVAALTACSGSGSTSNPQVLRSADSTRRCLLHQDQQPTTAYQGGMRGVTQDVLDFLGYYTAHGDQPFCDHKPATATDRAWARLYVRLTGNRGKVETILGRR